MAYDGHYRKIKVDGRWIYEHRHVMAEHVGRPLATTEIVHHLNGDRYDNRLANLELTTRSEHMRHHWEAGDLPQLGHGAPPKPKVECPVCGSMFKPKRRWLDGEGQDTMTCSQSCGQRWRHRR
jgi:hypothetical protein